MLGWIMGLNMGGGSGFLATNEHTLHVEFEDTVLHVTRGSYDLKTIYIDKDSDAKRISQDWSAWLNGSTIASATWLVQDGSNVITLSNATFNNTIVVNYINASVYNRELFLKCTIVTSDTIPETESRSFLIKTVRTF